MSKQLEYIVKEYIENYEKQNGKIDIKVGNIIGNNGTINM